MKCKNCLKQDVCVIFETSVKLLGEKIALSENINCCRFEDKSQWVKLPCKVGSKIYYIRSYTVGMFGIDYLVQETEFSINSLKQDFVLKDCFYLTKEEAQAELERLKERE